MLLHCSFYWFQSFSRAFQEDLYKPKLLHILFLLEGRTKAFLKKSSTFCKTKDAITFQGKKWYQEKLCFEDKFNKKDYGQGRQNVSTGK